MKYREVRGNLFAQGHGQNLAHCVSADFKMSRGIAKIFRNKFGGIHELCASHTKVGQTAKLTRDHRHIFYLVTKNKYYQKPTISSLKKCLLHLKTQVVELGIINLDIPKISSGLDRIPWDITRQLLLEIFSDLVNFELTVWYQ